MNVQVVGAPRQEDGEIHAPENTIAAATSAPQPSSPSALAAATDGSLAGKMLARANEVGSRTKRFPVPGWEDEDGEPSLVLVARQTKKRPKGGSIRNEAFIDASTAQLLFRDDDGELKALEDGWRTVALTMSADGNQHSVGDAIRKTLSDGNEMRLDFLAAQILTWNLGSREAAENALGE